MPTLKSKVAIVTGASKGIGRQIATELAAAGARVAVNYSSDREGAERVVRSIVEGGGEAIAVGADVSRAADVARLFNEVDADGIRVNAVAPGVIRTPIHGDADVDAYGSVALLNRVGEVNETTAAVPYLVDAGFITGHVLRVDGGYVTGRA